MKTKTAARVRPVPSQRSQVVYRRMASLSGQSQVRTNLISLQPFHGSTFSLSCDVIPKRNLTSNAAGYMSGTIRKYPEHTVLESVGLLVPARLEI